MNPRRNDCISPFSCSEKDIETLYAVILILVNNCVSAVWDSAQDTFRECIKQHFKSFIEW
jgi:hypothetical protein